VVVAAVGLSSAATCLAIAGVLDSPFLAGTGAVLVLLVLAAREGSMWHGRGRQRALMVAGLLAVVVVAFGTARLFA